MFTPPGEEPVAGGTIDLIARVGDPAPIAWFSVDEADHDEFRDAVSLFGDQMNVFTPRSSSTWTPVRPMGYNDRRMTFQKAVRS